MAFDFLKKGLFKKSKAEVKHEENTIEANHLETEETVKPPVNNCMSQEEKEAKIKERIRISENSPLKLLWNVFYSNTDNKYAPTDYVLKPIIEANTKINASNQESEYVSFDDNQKEFIAFTKRIHSLSVKYLKQIFQECIDESIDSYAKDIEMHEFDTVLKESTDHAAYEELKCVFEANKKEGLKNPFDSQIIIQTTKDKLHVWIMIVPSLNGGMEVNEESLKKVLADNGVVYGIAEELITAVCQKKKYLQIFEIATGDAVVNGKDGYITEYFDRENNITIREDEKGNLNYKELNNIKSIHKGDVICDIVYPVDGVDGVRVDGKVVTARQGKKPKIPKGKNLIFNEDETQLISDKDGELVFKDGVFLVNELLTIEHDVDNASGNIDFSGSVLIKGDVREGFSVKAEGDITILGTAEGATIVSASNVIIKHGMTGGGKGIIRASGNIKCVFLENCTAYAKGNIDVDQVMYSELSSGDSIYISGKKGSVTGGKLIAGKAIKANIIGAANNACLKTEIVIGCTPQMIKRQSNINHSLKEVTDKLFKVNQDINYIESNIDKMPKERLKMLEQLKIQVKFIAMQKETLEKNLEELTAQMDETTKACDLRCKELNPIVNFTVGESSYSLNKQLHDCHLYMKENVAVISSMSLAENIEF